eukprot:193745-Hanusia_phi.AAC.1
MGYLCILDGKRMTGGKYRFGIMRSGDNWADIDEFLHVLGYVFLDGKRMADRKYLFPECALRG